MKIILLASTLLLSGCAPAIIGSGAVVGCAAVSEHGLTGSLTDTQISTQIRYKLYQHDSDLYTCVGVNVHKGEVLLTGAVANEMLHIDAIRLTWEVTGVTRVIDQITVSEGPGFKVFAQDSWITTRLNSVLVFDKDVRSVNYSIKTMDGIVYLMGIAQDDNELKRVVNHARNTRGVKKVVSYVTVKDVPAAPISSAIKDSENLPSAE